MKAFREGLQTPEQLNYYMLQQRSLVLVRRVVCGQLICPGGCSTALNFIFSKQQSYTYRIRLLSVAIPTAHLSFVYVNVDNHVIHTVCQGRVHHSFSCNSIMIATAVVISMLLNLQASFAIFVLYLTLLFLDLSFEDALECLKNLMGEESNGIRVYIDNDQRKHVLGLNLFN